MTESNTTQIDQIIERRGYQIRLTQAGPEWISAVASPEQRPMVIMAPDREAVIDKAYAWIDLDRLQLAPDKTSK